MKHAKLLATLGVAMLFAVPSFATTTFAQFTQTNDSKVVTYGATDSGNTLSVAGAATNFVVTAFGPAGLYPATFTLNGTSSDSVVNTGFAFRQTGWSGSMSFTNGGDNLLTVNFADALLSVDLAGGSGSLFSTSPPSFIESSSSVLDLSSLFAQNFSIALTGITPAFGIGANGFGNAFTSNAAGSFAGAIPEPTTWAMLVIGFGLTGAVIRRSKVSHPALA